MPAVGDDLVANFRRVFIQCSGFQAKEVQEILTANLDHDLRFNDGKKYLEELKINAEILLRPDGLRGAMQAAGDAYSEYSYESYDAYSERESIASEPPIDLSDAEARLRPRGKCYAFVLKEVLNENKDFPFSEP